MIGAVESPLRLHVLPLELSASDSTPSVRAVAQIIELVRPASSTLSLLRVSAPSGAVQAVATRGSDIATFGIRVAVFNSEMQAVSAFGLELVATLVATLVGGSAASWSPTSSMPGSLVRTTELGVFEGLLRVNLGENDPAAAFRIGVRVSGVLGEVVVETTVVDVVRMVGFTATTATLTEGMDAVELRIEPPLHPIGSRIEIDFAVSGTAMMGSDYTLLAASTQPGIMLASDSTAVITLLLEATAADDIRLLLRPRADDLISQGTRSLNLSIVRYVVHSTENVSFALPPPLDFTIIDDELPVAKRLLDVGNGVACALLNGGSVRCWFTSGVGAELRGALSSANIRSPRQLAIGSGVFCWLRSDNTVSCGPGASGSQLMIPSDLSDVTAISLGLSFACTLHRGGEVRCWGQERTPPPDDLGEVTQLASGTAHTCALTVEGAVSCWGRDIHGQSSPPMDLPPVKTAGPRR